MGPAHSSAFFVDLAGFGDLTAVESRISRECRVSDCCGLACRLSAGSAFGILHPSWHSSAFCTPGGTHRHFGAHNSAFNLVAFLSAVPVVHFDIEDWRTRCECLEITEEVGKSDCFLTYQSGIDQRDSLIHRFSTEFTVVRID